MQFPIAIANWKMNPQNLKEAQSLALSCDAPKTAICPPFVFLRTVKETVKKAEVGGQNCFFEKTGSFTGEISPSMLKSEGCTYVILGHSERRNVFQENNYLINQKAKAALEEGIIPILCVGDFGGKEGEEKILAKQLLESLEDINLENVIIAYEPLFAIGTGNPCPLQKAKERREFILETISQKEEISGKTPLFYGGSVSVENAAGYIKEAGFDGLLVGGASLKEGEFAKIAKEAGA